MSGIRLDLDGAAVYVGAGGGDPRSARSAIAFLHGAGMDHTVWALPARHFARRGLRVAAPDLPGHGRSGGAPLASIAAMGDWLARLLDALDIADAIVAGHSMGALIAWQFACMHPGRCRSLALLGASLPMPVADALLAAARDDDSAAPDMANAWSHSRRALLGGSAVPGIWMHAAGRRLLQRAAPGVLHADLAACNAFDAAAAGGEPNCPARILIGEADRMTPAAAGLDVAARLPQGRVIRLPGCGHAMLAEQPNAVLDALIEWVGLVEDAVAGAAAGDSEKTTAER